MKTLKLWEKSAGPECSLRLMPSDTMNQGLQVTIRALPDDEDALGQLPSPLPKRVAVVVSVEGAMLCGKKEEAD